MPDMHFNCPACAKSLVIDEQAAGRVVRCPDCGSSVQVPRKPVAGRAPLRPSVPASTIPGGVPIPQPLTETQRCPWCAAVIGKDDVPCVKCGTNLKTGQKVGSGFEEQASRPSGSGKGGLLVAVAAVAVMGVGGAAFLGWRMMRGSQATAKPPSPPQHSSPAASVAIGQAQPEKPSASFAVLNDTVEQVERKLGTHRVARAEGGKSIRFYKDPGGGLNHQITFVDGKAVSIQYGREDEQSLTPDQIKSFLDANADGQTWVEAEKGRTWARDNQEVIGEWLPNQKYLFSVVYMKVAAEAVHEWRTAAAMQDTATDPKSVYEAGLKLAQGDGIAQDDIKAFELISKAANQGYLLAQHDLAVMYNTGQGCTRDSQEAMKWFTTAASRGELASQLALGWMLVCGQGVQKDPRAGFGWYEKAYKQGNMFAAFAMGALYEDGAGVVQDKRMAAKLYLEAAEKGNVEAQKAIGRMYHENANDDESIHWYRKAAAQGDDFAKLVVKAYESDHAAPASTARVPCTKPCPYCGGTGKAYESFIGGVWIPYPEPRRDLGYRGPVTCRKCGGTGKMAGPSGGTEADGTESTSSHDISPAAAFPPRWQVSEGKPGRDGARVFDENQYLAKHYGRFGGAFATVSEAAEKAKVLNTQTTMNLDAMKEAAHNAGPGLYRGNFRLGRWRFKYDETLDRFVVYQE